MDNFADLLKMLKTLMGIKSPDTSRDDELTAYLRGAIVACETYLDDVIDRREVTQAWVEGQSPLLLRYSFAAALTNVTLDGEDVTSEWQLLAADGYSKLYRVDETILVFAAEKLTATYTAGYASCPYDLMLAIATTAAAMESKAGDGGAAPNEIIKKESVTGIGTVEYDTTGVVGETSPVGMIPATAVQILDMYRKVGV